MEKLTLAVIGTSWISEAFCTSATKAGFEITSVCSGHIENAEKFAKKFAATEWYKDVDDMLENTKVDAVYIATPNKFHVPYSLKFLQKGINVISEKPISDESSEVKKCLEAAKENNVFFFEAMRSVHNPVIKEFKEVLDNTDSVLRSAFFNFSKYSSMYDEFRQGIIRPRFSVEYKGGALNDLGIYIVYAAHYFFGKPNNILASAVHLHNKVDAVTNMIFEYDTFNLTLVTSKVSNSTIENDVEFEDVTYKLNHMTAMTTVTKFTKSETVEIINNSDYDDLYSEAKDFYDIIKTKDVKAYEFYSELAVDVVETMETIHKIIDL